jgi:glycosyltransferase involved in cell wall biosynthesis
MRILLVNEARMGGGGVESYLAALVPELRARGHEVALLYANTRAEQGPTDVNVDPSWSVRDLGLPPAIDAARAWRPDVCFAHNMRYLEIDEAIVGQWPTIKMMHAYAGACLSGHKAFSFPAAVACPRACNAGCLVYFLPRRCGRLRPDVMVTQYRWARRQQALLPRYDGVVVASEHMRGEFGRYGAARIATIPLFTAGPAASGGVRDIDVAFFGRLTPLTGPDLLIEALAHASRALARPLRALVAGDGPLRPDLVARTSASGADVQIDVPGWLHAAERDAALARTSVLAVPSRWPEPFGLVGLEAARFGVPSVAFDTGGIRTWLSDGVNGLLVPPSEGPRGFGDTLARALGDERRLAALSANAREASARFSAAAHIDALEQVLQQWRRPGTC